MKITIPLYPGVCKASYIGIDTVIPMAFDMNGYPYTPAPSFPTITVEVPDDSTYEERKAIIKEAVIKKYIEENES